MKTLLTYGMGIAALSMTVAANAWDSEMRQELTLDAKALSTLRVDAAAGYLTIRGDKKATDVSVVATLVGDDPEQGEYRLSLRKDADDAVLVAKIIDDNDDVRMINLDVVVPATFKLYIEDGSGDINIDEIENDIEVHDGSGKIALQTIAGDIQINDGSGDISANVITGDLDIEDGSGGIDLRVITGDIKLDDGSGSIDIEVVTGNISIDDGSGSINVSTVTGSVEVDDASGDIYVDTATSFTLLDDGSGKVRLHNVDSENVMNSRLK